MSFESIFKKWALNPSASIAVLDGLASALGFSLPADYLELLRAWNGGEGMIGTNFLVLWRAEELKIFNEEYEVEEYAPGLFLFGSNGAGEGYGFDMRDNALPIVQVPFIGMELRYADFVAANFTDFLEKLAL